MAPRTPSIPCSSSSRKNETGSFISGVAALALGFALAAVHQVRNRSTRSLSCTLAVLPAIVYVVIALVNGNVCTGVAVAGAFSLARFRSVPGSARDMGFVFLAMRVGLACGMGYLGVAALTTFAGVGRTSRDGQSRLFKRRPRAGRRRHRRWPAAGRRPAPTAWRRRRSRRAQIECAAGAYLSRIDASPLAEPNFLRCGKKSIPVPRKRPVPPTGGLREGESYGESA